MEYIKYLRRWYRTYGFSSKSPILRPYQMGIPYFRPKTVIARHEFLMPWAFYRELKEKQSWIKIARSKRIADSKRHTGRYVSAPYPSFEENKYKN